MKITVEFWNRDSIELNSYKAREEIWEGRKNEIFEKMYHSNNRYRYCSGTYYKFANPKIEKEYYNIFFPAYNTIEHFYNGGIVD